ncbi:hypothetical protein COOONC_04598 [Cooperia oncophora]
MTVVSVDSKRKEIFQEYISKRVLIEWVRITAILTVRKMLSLGLLSPALVVTYQLTVLLARKKLYSLYALKEIKAPDMSVKRGLLYIGKNMIVKPVIVAISLNLSLSEWKG